MNPSVVQALAQTAEQLREQEQFLTPLIQEKANAWIRRTDAASRFDLAERPESWIARSNILEEIRRLDPQCREIGYEDLVRIERALGNGSRVSVSRGLELTLDGEAALLRRRSSLQVWEEVSIEPGAKVLIEQIDAEVDLRQLPEVPDVTPPASGLERFQVRKAFEAGDFRLRPRRRGERFQPLGCDHEKKLKDVFINRKIPRENRDTLPLLVLNGEVVWVGSIGVSDKFKIGTDPGEWFEIGFHRRSE